MRTPRIAGLRWIGLGAVVTACLGYLVVSATGTSAQYYETIPELRSHASAGDVRVLGTVQDDVTRSDGGLHVRFSIADGAQALLVDYTGTVPDIFKPGIQVVAQGSLGRDGVFHATALQAKCPSRFTAASPSPGP